MTQLLKGFRLYSILKGTCPVCQEESMYKNKNPYALKTIFEMNENCTHCNTKYKIEPSFFFGAMYVSYPVGIIFASIAFMIAYAWLDLSLTASFFVLVAVLIVMLPVIIRLSRNIWINLFMGPKKLSKASKAI